jgi:hypothetical protein
VVVRWKLRLYDWNDSPRHTNDVHGTGSTIFYLDSHAPAITYDYTPADAGDRFSARAPGTRKGEMTAFGVDEKARGANTDRREGAVRSRGAVNRNR